MPYHMFYLEFFFDMHPFSKVGLSFFYYCVMYYWQDYQALQRHWGTTVLARWKTFKHNWRWFWMDPYNLDVPQLEKEGEFFQDCIPGRKTPYKPIDYSIIPVAVGPQAWQMYFQEPASPIMEGLIEFHNDLMLLLIFVVFFVLYLIISIVYHYHNPSSTQRRCTTSTNVSLETLWTILPAGILFLVSIPSFGLLYAMDELVDPAVTLKAVGHQWYWSYEYSDSAGLIPDDVLQGDHYMEPYPTRRPAPVWDRPTGLGSTKGLAHPYHPPISFFSDSHPTQPRLLSTTKIFLPTDTHIRVLTTAVDVVHSWTVPAIGVKLDACPGRLNQAALFLKRLGTFYGQCSELCGVNHGFMPIVLKSVPFALFFEILE